tara:strand:+ start:89 stop:505 length:417 start_codon:yes stop_codon:yes gene_type:complete
MVKQFLVDTTINDIITKQKQYKKQKLDIKKTYVGIGGDGKIVQRKKYDFYGKDLWKTRDVLMEDCSIDLIYYTNSSLDYNRIVYINPKNKTLVKKYLPALIKSANTISDWFLQCKYNPKYKYCRDKQYQDLLDIYEEQ